MRRRWAGVLALAVALGTAGNALAEAGRPRPAPPKTRSKPAGARAPRPAATATRDAGAAATRPDARPEQRREAEAAEAPSSEPAPQAADAEPPEKRVRGQDSAGSAPAVVETEETQGLRSYKFSGVEVEGRLKSPQMSYFLRRVRAEFGATDLGHRSFLRELSHTRHDPALR